MKQTVLIILLCISASIVFGILHNQISARVSLEYFTIGHYRLISSESPTLMGIAWGIHSTWWVGLIFGVLLALAGRAGKWEKRTARSLVKPVLLLSAVCGAAALIAGFIAYRLMSTDSISFISEMSLAIEPARQPGFLAALWMHTASYTVGTMGGLIIAVRVFACRLHSGKNS